MTTGALTLAREITALLDTLGIDYVIGGSVASSLVGEPRATVDLDLADLRSTAQAEDLTDLLERALAEAGLTSP